MSSRFGFEVSASFEELFPTSERQYSGVRNDERGVLMSCRMSPSEILGHPGFFLRFVRTQLEMGHDDILDEYPSRKYDATHHPFMRLQFGGSIFRMAARYTLRNYPVAGSLGIALMMGSLDKQEEVRSLPGYQEARHTLAVACAQAVLDPLVDGQERRVGLHVVHNFDNFGLRTSESFSGIGNLQQFHEFLRTESS